jgi:hypothetical protein
MMEMPGSYRPDEGSYKSKTRHCRQYRVFLGIDGLWFDQVEVSIRVRRSQMAAVIKAMPATAPIQIPGVARMP